MSMQEHITEPRIPGRMPRWPLRDLDIGDTYFCVGATIYQARHCVAKWAPKKFRCRTMRINGVPGVYVVRFA